MSYLTTEGRLYFLSLTRPVTHLCYNISYNTIYYYIIVRCYDAEYWSWRSKENTGLPKKYNHQHYTIIYYYSIVRTTAILLEHHA